MSAGRRGLMLSVVFLSLAVWLCPAKRVRAQPGRPAPPQQVRPNDPGAGKHRIWNGELTPEQIRDALARFGKGDGKADEMFLEMLRKFVGEKNPKATPEQIDAAAKRLMEDKEFRDQVIDAVQRHKNRNPDAWKGNDDKPPRTLTREEIAKWIQVKPDGNDGDPFVLPPDVKIDRDKLQPFNPKNPNFDPKKFPGIDPNNPPDFDPKTGLPVDPKTGKLFDPRNGQPLDPKDLQPFNPKNPNFDPQRFPAIDPKKPPEFDPKTGFPKDRNTGKPFDPRNGQPIDPNNPPNIEQRPEPPKINQPPELPPQPPKIDPPDNRKFDPENPLGQPPDAADKAAKAKAVETATAIWEKNVGPIEDSPGVKRALIDLVSDPEAMQALTDGKGNNLFEMLEKDGGNGEKFGDWFGGGGNDFKWEWPKFDFGRSRRDNDLDIDFGRDRGQGRDRDWWSRDSSRSSGSSSFDGMGSFNLGGMQVPFLLLLILLVVIVAAVLWWKFGGAFKPRQATLAIGGGGGWPVDPREINTREDVVKVFEYLSVMLCGSGAKTWTHSTIADELSKLAASEPETALKLARLYELARYAPLDEPLTRAELLEARRLACELAGIDEV